jgi:hypothetical protein
LALAGDRPQACGDRLVQFGDPLQQIGRLALQPRRFGTRMGCKALLSYTSLLPGFGVQDIS